MVSIRRFAAIALQLAMLVLPFSGGNAHDRHCANPDRAPASTTVPCHSMPACSTAVMQPVAATVIEPVAIATLIVEAAATAPLSVTYTPDPPPPRA